MGCRWIIERVEIRVRRERREGMGKWEKERNTFHCIADPNKKRKGERWNEDWCEGVEEKRNELCEISNNVWTDRGRKRKGG